MPLICRTIILIVLVLSACAPKAVGPAVVEQGVRFSVALPAARQVAVAGDFNRWDPDRDRLSGPDAQGVWTVTLPLPAGRYEYRFVVDGAEWVLDPAAPKTDDGLGGWNSLVIVPAGAGR